jgi:hypothetical protein
MLIARLRSALNGPGTREGDAIWWMVPRRGGSSRLLVAVRWRAAGDPVCVIRGDEEENEATIVAQIRSVAGIQAVLRGLGRLGCTAAEARP